MKKRTRIAFFLPVLVSHWWIDPLNFIQNDAEANPANQSESSANCRIIDETMFSFKLFETSTENLDFVAKSMDQWTCTPMVQMVEINP